MTCSHYTSDRRKKNLDSVFWFISLLNYQKITYRHKSLIIILSIRNSLNHKVSLKYYTPLVTEFGSMMPFFTYYFVHCFYL